MKNTKRFWALCVLAVVFLLTFALAACDTDTPDPTPPDNKDKPNWTLTSPDGKITLDVYFAKGQIAYSVAKGDVTVVEKSNIGMATDKCEFVDLTFVESQTDSKTISYTNVSGKTKQVTTSFKQNILTFAEGDYMLDVVFRAYNDGYAFRYNIRKADGTEGDFTVTDELTHFALPGNAKTYAMAVVTIVGLLGGDEYYSYEDKYQYRSYKNLTNEQLGFPVLYSVKSGDDEVYSLITEADIYGREYHGSALQADGTDGLKTIHMPACGSEASMSASYPFTSPWRVAVVGGPDTMVESTLVEDVYDEIEPWKPDDYDSLSEEEKQIYTYDWVKPGAAAWSYLNFDGDPAKQAAQSNYELQRQYVDAIADLGWTWLVLDAGWDTGSFTEKVFVDFVQYANAKGVHIMVWADSYSSFYTRTQTSATLAKWAKWGIEGVKIDFFDGQGAPYLSDKWKLESQQSLDDHYEMFYQEAAKYKMVVDCHGCNKPTGERRQYPHVINREAVRGNEFKSVDSKQTAYLPFTRSSIGPTDFTPAIIPYLSGTVTVAHNMGLAVTLESGMPTFSDMPDHFTSGEYLDFYRNLPVVWDETKLVTADLGDYVVIARRSGNKWYVGCTASYAGTIDVDLSFLGEGNFAARIWQDSEYNKVSQSSQSVTSASKLSLTVQKGGGFTMIIE
ncbi:MAG TPA: hypothetical protein DHU79_00670 [Clostridiales bacterium]|nr:hypothetical protein [Clostridiales bacterium]